MWIFCKTFDVNLVKFLWYLKSRIVHMWWILVRVCKSSMHNACKNVWCIYDKRYNCTLVREIYQHCTVLCVVLWLSSKTLCCVVTQLQDTLAAFEQEKFDMQKQHTRSMQELLDDTNSRLQRMEDEYTEQMQQTVSVHRADAANSECALCRCCCRRCCCRCCSRASVCVYS